MPVEMVTAASLPFGVDLPAGWTVRRRAEVPAGGWALEASPPPTHAAAGSTLVLFAGEPWSAATTLDDLADRWLAWLARHAGQVELVEREHGGTATRPWTTQRSTVDAAAGPTSRTHDHALLGLVDARDGSGRAVFRLALVSTPQAREHALPFFRAVVTSLAPGAPPPPADRPVAPDVDPGPSPRTLREPPRPISVALPQEWAVAQPSEQDRRDGLLLAARHPRPERGVAAVITVGWNAWPRGCTLHDLADVYVSRLVRDVGPVGVVTRADHRPGPGLRQTLAVRSSLATGRPRDVLQDQVVLGVVDPHDPARRFVIELALTCSAEQLDEVVDEFDAVVATLATTPPAGHAPR